MKGLTATNLIKNGDFSNGKTGWKENSTTSSVLGGELIFQILNVQSILSQGTINVNKDDIIYWKVSLKGTGSFNMRTRISIGGEYVNIYGNTITLSNNQYIDVSTSSKALVSGILFFSVYATNIIDTGSIYMKKPLMINLTQYLVQVTNLQLNNATKCLLTILTGTKSTVSASRLKSVSEDETQESTQYLPNVGELRSLPNGTKDEIRVSAGKSELIQRVSDTMEELAEPIITPIQTSGNLISYPSGTVYLEKCSS